MFKNNRNLIIIALIAVVNALGYGIIIPILYSYSLEYGLSDFDNGLLFAVFSVFQFISTPIIGRLSDKYGRKPLLVSSIAGTALSFFMMAFAPNAFFLFVARALDGITAGNIPVASAVITDTTDVKDRAKGFGIIGAAFGFGFIFGPAISALTVTYNPALPFIIAGIVSIVAVVITALYLPETNKNIGKVHDAKMFDFKKMIHALLDKNVGLTLMMSLFYSTAFTMLIYAYQPFSVKVLNLSVNQISALFTVFGVLGLISQLFVLPNITKYFGVKTSLSSVLITVATGFFIMFFFQHLYFFIGASVILGLTNSTIMPLLQTILSRETDDASQGTMQGINASYMSIGQIIGPILGGVFATFSIPTPFLVGGVFLVICFMLSFHVLQRGHPKESLFTTPAH